ncbi:hypothetical protein [Flavisolibacter nicotianae]|uniref:hypothetical protein n=1 Tax=Flavisolibacter nicotianae TaxID=2364882 RepID=UPI000EAB82F2|nr:hypothetical protein [Flavisolibacter nicotianae]
MNEKLKDILSNLHSEVDQETLLKYLQGHLTDEEQNAVEKNLLDDPFESEAMEGLQTIPDKNHISDLVEQLNRDLKKKTARKKSRRIRRDVRIEPWLLLAIVMILLMVIIAFIVIYRTGK